MCDFNFDLVLLDENFGYTKELNGHLATNEIRRFNNRKITCPTSKNWFVGKQNTQSCRAGMKICISYIHSPFSALGDDLTAEVHSSKVML